jgi:Tfp pilus assembly protein PilW
MSRRGRLRGERGYTLIEMLAATGAGLTIVAAMVAVLVGAYQLLQNDADRVDANQQGRTAMAQIAQLLNSSCVAGVDVSPIVGDPAPAGSTAPPSGANSITFYSSLSDAPEISQNVDEVVVFLNGAGALQEDVYRYVSGSTGDWVFASTPSSTATLVDNATDSPNTQSTMFTYYPFTTNGQLSAAADTLDAAGHLSASAAQAVGAVGIRFEAEPTDASHAPGSDIDLSDQVVLRLSPVANASGATSSTGATTTPYPCS